MESRETSITALPNLLSSSFSDHPSPQLRSRLKFTPERLAALKKKHSGVGIDESQVSLPGASRAPDEIDMNKLDENEDFHDAEIGPHDGDDANNTEDGGKHLAYAETKWTDLIAWRERLHAEVAVVDAEIQLRASLVATDNVATVASDANKVDEDTSSNAPLREGSGSYKDKGTQTKVYAVPLKKRIGGNLVIALRKRLAMFHLPKKSKFVKQPEPKVKPKSKAPKAKSPKKTRGKMQIGSPTNATKEPWPEDIKRVYHEVTGLHKPPCEHDFWRYKNAGSGLPVDQAQMRGGLAASSNKTSLDNTSHAGSGIRAPPPSSSPHDSAISACR